MNDSEHALIGLLKGLKREYRDYFIGLSLLLCAVVFYFFAVLRIDYAKTALLDLHPHPDAVEYFAQAKSLLKEGRPEIQIGYDKLPSRFPFGYPVLMLPWLKILPERDSILAPFRTNQTLGLLLLLIAFGFYSYIPVPLAGGFAALLLATLPGFFTFCRSSLSEISASALIVSAFMFAYLGLTQERRWKIYVSAILLGLSLNVRIQSVFFAPLLFGMALFPARGMRLRWFLHCAAVSIVFVLAAIPVLILNAIEFHSPFKTGYDFWLPGWTGNHLLFSLHYIPGNAAMLWREFALRPDGSFGLHIFGTGTSFVPAFIVLVCVGFFFLRLTRFVICAFLASLAFLVAMASFRFADGRLYLPLLILLVAVAVLPVTWAARNLLVVKRIVPVAAIFALFVAACLGYPSRSGYNTVESQAWDALHLTTLIGQSPHFIAQKNFVELSGQQPGMVLSDIDPIYLNALLPKPFVAAPLDWKHNYRYSKLWRYGRRQAAALVRSSLAQALPVYALFISQKEMNEKVSRLPELDGYEWVPAESSTKGTVVLKLSPNIH